MERYTVNVSRARAAGRMKRARKAVSILRDELERVEGDVVLSREINQEIWKRGATKPPAKVSVKIVEEDGKKIAYPAEDTEGSERNEESREKESESNEYEDIVSGTIDDAKDTIEEMESPDYEALLEAEESGKDRKTLKDWIESQMS